MEDAAMEEDEASEPEEERPDGSLDLPIQRSSKGMWVEAGEITSRIRFESSIFFNLFGFLMFFGKKKAYSKAVS